TLAPPMVAPEAGSRVVTFETTTSRIRSLSVTYGVNRSWTPNGTNCTPWMLVANPEVTGTGNSPPARNDAGWPLVVTRFGSARVRAKFKVRSAEIDALM